MNLEFSVFALLTVEAVFGLGSLVYLTVREAQFEQGSCILYIMWMLLLIALVDFLTSFILTSTTSSNLPWVQQSQTISLVVVILVLTISSAATVKVASSKLPSAASGRMIAFLANSALILFAGALSATVSGLIRSIAYHVGYADYTLSSALNQEARRKNVRKIYDFEQERRACLSAISIINAHGDHFQMLTVSSRWLPYREIIYDIVPGLGSFPGNFRIKYRYYSGVADRAQIVAGTYTFTLNDHDCRTNVRPFEGPKALAANDMTARLRDAVRATSDSIERQRKRPAHWSIIAAGGAFKDLGADGFEITPANGAARRVEKFIWWFQKLFFGLLLAAMFVPARPFKSATAPKPSTDKGM